MMLFQFGLFGGDGLDPTNLGVADIFVLALSVVRIALGLIGAIALIYILVGGIQFITAGGDPGKQAEARKAIVAAIVGVIIASLSFALTNVVLQQVQFRYTIIQENDTTRPVQDLFTN